MFGQVDGWIDAEEGFDLGGLVELRLLGLSALGATGLVSTKGMAACAWLGSMQVGVGYRWGGDLEELWGCDMASSGRPSWRPPAQGRRVTAPAPRAPGPRSPMAPSVTARGWARARPRARLSMSRKRESR